MFFMRGSEITRHHCLHALVLVLISLSLQGQVQWSVDTTQIQWGEPLQLTAEWFLSMEELQSGVADSMSWPMWQDTTTSGFEILASSPIDTIAAPMESGMDILLKKTWMLTSWDSGFVVIPPESFGPHETSPLLIRVVTPLLAEDAQPMPPNDIVAVKWNLWERIQRAWPAFVILALLLGLWLLGRLIWRTWFASQGQKQKSVSEVHVEPPHILALKILNGLKLEKGWMKGRAKEVQAQASMALRHYLERRFGLPAAERTTEDIAALMPTSEVPEAWQPRLIQALNQADAVKFAKGHLSARTHLAIIEAYIDFVLDTQIAEDEAS